MKVKEGGRSGDCQLTHKNTHVSYQLTYDEHVAADFSYLQTFIVAQLIHKHDNQIYIGIYGDRGQRVLIGMPYHSANRQGAISCSRAVHMSDWSEHTCANSIQSSLHVCFYTYSAITFLDHKNRVIKTTPNLQRHAKMRTGIEN